MAYTLLVGNKNYSSWSLRPWLVLTEAGLPFTERLVSLQPDAGKAARFAALPAWAWIDLAILFFELCAFDGLPGAVMLEAAPPPGFREVARLSLRDWVAVRP